MTKETELLHPTIARQCSTKEMQLYCTGGLVLVSMNWVYLSTELFTEKQWVMIPGRCYSCIHTTWCYVGNKLLPAPQLFLSREIFQTNNKFYLQTCTPRFVGQQLLSNISVLESCFCPPGECFSLPLCFSLSTNSWGKYLAHSLLKAPRRSPLSRKCKAVFLSLLCGSLLVQRIIVSLTIWRRREAGGSFDSSI